jgi:hypothetical protein
MTILRGTIRDPEKADKAIALTEMQQLLLSGSSTEPSELVSLASPPSCGESEQQDGRGWSGIDDASLSAAQRAAEVHNWTPQMVAARV